MKLDSRHLAAVFSVFALTGCGGGGANGSAAGSSAAGGGDVIALTSTGAPKRADGYWALKNIGGGGTVLGTQYLCVGGGSEEKSTAYDQIAININCSRHEFKRDGAGWTFDISCGAPPMVSEAKGTITGDFVKSYKIEMRVKEEGREMGRTIEASNGGACPAGVAPGDLMDESGKKVASVTN